MSKNGFDGPPERVIIRNKENNFLQVIFEDSWTD
jgi:hypothetical protein